ncbi:MAG: hypothetical protein KME03_17765 [Aphanocapsa lilacina HA4352-LM1]|nr:hypothetical protein [Aphanocapsa lilacina HA4352-LM1]
MRILDPAARERLAENLRQVGAQLHAFGQEIQALTDESDRQYNAGEIAQFYARREAAA